MCFSLEASALASGALLITGATAVVKTRHTPLVWYAAIPLLFGVQQGIEALQWWVDKPSAVSTALGYAFLCFAFLWWPFYIPFVMTRIEKEQKRKMMFSKLTVLGACVSAYLLLMCVLYPLNVVVQNQCLVYDIHVPFFWIIIPVYIFVTCTTLFSSRPRVRQFGVVTLAGCAIAAAAYTYAFTSVWCFFAALLSAFVLCEVYVAKKKKR